MSTRKPITIGQKFGLLTLIREVETIVYSSCRGWVRVVECKCDCGKIKTYRLGDLRVGYTKSCGCLKDKNTSERARTHGLSKELIAATWYSIRQRCYNEGDANYHHYGGRGIKMCDRWFDSLENFNKDMGPRPSPKHSIDRIDPNGNYEPSNCRWATQKQQMRNLRNNKRFEYEGQLLTIGEISEITGIASGCLYYRIKEKGMSAAQAVNTKHRYKK